MSDIAALVANNLDIWTSAIERKSGGGRGGGRRISLHGIDRLRALILDLAVRGKLVSQDAGDEPAEQFLKRLRVPIRQNPKPSLNPGWAEASLADLGEFVGGITPSKGVSRYWGEGHPWVSPKDMSEDQLITSEDQVTQAALEETSLKMVPAGSLVMVARSGILRRKFPVAITNMPCTLNQDMKALVLRPSVNQRYLQVMLKGFQPRVLSDLVKTGMTVESLIFKDFTKALWPLPPLAEQQRIVAKVDELMALCDALERESAGALAAHEALVEMLLATLVNSADATDLARNWARLERHFDTLFTTDASIDALKQTILDLAVRGKLVEQDARDEPAPTLLKRIAEEIADFCTENRITAARTDRIAPAQLLFGVPDGWAWSRLAGIFKVITDGDHQPPPKADQGVAFLTIGNVTTGKLAFDGCRLVPESYFKALAKYRTPRQGDILYTVVGATYGRPALVETDRDFCVQRHIAILKPSESMDVGYMVILLSSPVAYRQASEGTTGSAQPTIALRPLRNFLVPIPPLAEQRRIVAKVNALMALCETMKTQLSQAAQTRRNLADAITERAVA